MLRLLASAAIAASLIPVAAQAVPVSFDLFGTAASGATLTATFGYDTDATVTGSGPTYAEHDNAGFLTGMISGGAFDGTSFSLTGGLVAVVNDFDVNPPNGDLSDFFLIEFDESELFMENFDATAFSDTSLPTALSLADWERRFVLISDVDLTGQTRQEERFTIQSLSRTPTAPVPLPATLPLAVAGLGALALIRRRARI